MLKRLLSALLIVFLFNLAAMPAVFAGESNVEKEAKFIEKIRINIQKLGEGPDAQVEIKLRDNTKIKGYVKEANNERVTVIDKKTGQAMPIPYSQVKQVKGNNLSSRVVFAIGFAALIVVLIVLLGNAKD